MEHRSTLFLMVGLPGSGKTTEAQRLAVEHAALRLSPDAWMVPLFGEPEANGRRDVLEGRLIWVALESLRLGLSVVLDFGFWGRDERSSLRWLAESVRASCRVVYLPVDPTTQRQRLSRRWTESPEATFPTTAADLAVWRGLFEVPEESELEGSGPGDPPTGWADWRAWAEERWPSLATG